MRYAFKGGPAGGETHLNIHPVVTPVLKTFVALIPEGEKSVNFVNSKSSPTKRIGLTAGDDATGAPGIIFASAVIASTGKGNDILRVGYIQNVEKVANGFNAADGKGRAFIEMDSGIAYASKIRKEYSDKGVAFPLLDAAAGDKGVKLPDTKGRFLKSG